jgi:Tol biopolymer transport system component
MIISDLGPSPNIRSVPIRGVIGRPSWSPDGNRIRFAVQDAVSETSVFWEVRRDASNLHPLPFHSEPGYVFEAGGWTADARYFIYTENKVDHPNFNLWILSENPALGRGQPMRLTNGPMNFESVAPGSDASTVFALGTDFNSELARFDSKRLEFVPFWKGVPAVDVAFSNDGGRAAYRRLPEGTLWISRSDGSEARQLTQPPLEAYQPHWSPDGARIAFMGRMPGKPYRIFVIGAAGGTPQAIKPDDAFDQGVPSWSSDGRYLVFGERRQRKPDSEMLIHLLDLVGGTESILPDSRGKWSPRWSPDGRYIVAVTTDFRSLVLFDRQAQRWTPLASGSDIDDATWSLDGRFVHFRARGENGMALFRVRITDAAVEPLAVCPYPEVAWAGVAPDGSPLVLHSTRIEEIYAMDLKLP